MRLHPAAQPVARTTALVRPVALALALASALTVPVGPSAEARAQGDRTRQDDRRQAEAALAEAEHLLEGPGRDAAVAALLPLERAADFAASARASRIYALARLLKGRALRRAAEDESAVGALDEALAVARSARERDLQLEVLAEAADLDAALGRSRDAVLRWREAVLVAGELGRDEERVLLLLHLADAAAEAGHREEARAALTDAAATSRRLGRLGLLRQARERRAELETRWGQPEAAIAELRDVLAETNEASAAGAAAAGSAASETGDPGEGPARLLLARALAAAGRRGEAAAVLAEAADACAREGDLGCQAEVAEERTAIELDAGRHPEAARAALELIQLRRRLGEPVGEARAHVGLARALRGLGRAQAARDALRAVKALGDDVGVATRALAHLEAARAEVALGRPAEAAAAYDEALELLAEAAEAAPAGAAAAGAAADRTGPPGALGALPDAGEAARERLGALADAGLWARALESCASCAAAGRDLEELRSAALQQQAAVVTWSALDDSVLAWALPPSGRVTGARVRGVGARALRQLAADARALAERVGVPAAEPAEEPVPGDAARRAGAGMEPEADSDRLWRSLRRLHDLLFAPLAEPLEETEALLVLPAEQVDGLPFEMLLDADGVPLGSRRAIAEWPAGAARPAGSPESVPALRLVADLRDPEHPGMDVRRLHAAFEGASRRREDERPGRHEPGWARARGPAEPSRPGVHPVGDDLIFVAGDRSAAAELVRLAPRAGLLVLLVACDRPGGGPELAVDLGLGLELELESAVAVLPACSAREGERAALELLRRGARAVLYPRWPVEAEAMEPIVRDILSGLAPGAPVGVATRVAIGPRTGSPARASLRLVGSVR